MAPERNGTLRSKSSTTPTTTRSDKGLISLRYEDSVPAKPPIPVTVAPPRAPPTDLHPALRNRPRPGEDENKRDSGLASTKNTEGSLNSATIEENVLGFTINFSPTPAVSLSQTPARTPPSTPKVVKKSYSMSGNRWRRPGSRKSTAAPRTPTSAGKSVEEDFSPITTAIPTDSLLDADFLDSLSFSKRGSIMFGGKKGVNGHSRPYGGRRWVELAQKIGDVADESDRQPSFSMLASPSIKVLSDDLEKESQKVRSMYEQGTGYDWQDGKYSANPELNIQEESPSEAAPPPTYVLTERV